MYRVPIVQSYVLNCGTHPNNHSICLRRETRTSGCSSPLLKTSKIWHRPPQCRALRRRDTREVGLGFLSVVKDPPQKSLDGACLRPAPLVVALVHEDRHLKTSQMLAHHVNSRGCPV